MRTGAPLGKVCRCRPQGSWLPPRASAARAMPPPAPEPQQLDFSLPSIQLLRDKFRDFARETGSIGQERVDSVNAIIERLIDAGHGEAATIAEWKDGLNEMWADLLELIDTRMQLLAASYDLHRYFYTSTEILGLIDEKHRELPEDVGLDASTAESFHRVHTAFERELQQLGTQVPAAPATPSPWPASRKPSVSGSLLAPTGELSRTGGTSRTGSRRFYLLREAMGQAGRAPGFQTPLAPSSLN